MIPNSVPEKQFCCCFCFPHLIYRELYIADLVAKCLFIFGLQRYAQFLEWQKVCLWKGNYPTESAGIMSDGKRPVEKG